MSAAAAAVVVTFVVVVVAVVGAATAAAVVVVVIFVVARNYMAIKLIELRASRSRQLLRLSSAQRATRNLPQPAAQNKICAASATPCRQQLQLTSPPSLALFLLPFPDLLASWLFRHNFMSTACRSFRWANPCPRAA